MIALSAAAFLHSFVAVGAILLAGAFYVAVVIPSEERQLSEAFPSEWAAYIASTPRLIPRFAWRSDGQHIEVDLRALRNESLRVLGMGAIPLVAQVLWHLRSEAWWPKYWTLP